MNEQIGNKINDKTYIKLTPFKGFVLENFPFIEADFDAITNYQLLCKVIEYLNNVISNQNQVQELGTELVNAYNSLVDYVNNYFDNNFPELVNDKLDEMASDGTLENLLNDALHLIRIFDTYDEMIESSDVLVNGQKLRTIGYYEPNDGGGATYYVTNGTPKSYEYYKELNNGLKLVLINDDFNVYKVDCLGMKKSTDNLEDTTTTSLNTTILQNLIDFLEANNVNGIIKFSNGLYKLNPIEINFAVRIKGESDNNDVAIEHSDYVGTTLLDMSDTTSPFITIEPTTGRLWGVIIENLKIAGLYKHHDGVIIRKAGHVTRLSNVTIMRFLGYGLYLDENNDTYTENLNIIECGYQDSETLKYALNLSSTTESYTTTNALHLMGIHLEHCRYAINIDYATQVFFNSLKVERGRVYSGSSIESNEPVIKITDKAYQVNFNNCTFTAGASNNDDYYFMRIYAVSAYNLRTRILTNCNFTSGYNAGGKYIYVEQSNTQISNCSFTNISPTTQSVVFDGSTNDISNCSFNLININTSTSPYVVYIKNLASINNCTINSLNSGGQPVYALNVSGGNKIGRINGLNNVTYLYNTSNASVEFENYDSLGVTSDTITNYGYFDNDGYFIFDFAKWRKPYHSILVTTLSSDLKIKEFLHFPLNYELILVNNQATYNVTLTQYGTLKLPNSTSSATLSGIGTCFTYLKTQSFGMITYYNTLQ